MAKSGCQGLYWSSSAHIAIVLWIIYFIFGVHCHPQCLDSRPPFQAAVTLSFCPEYSNFGCCTEYDVSILNERYRRLQQTIISSGEQDIWTNCSDYTRQFICQTCSPYAAHIFDAELRQTGSTIEARAFPGLCQNFCSTFYSKCKALVKYFMQEVGNTYTNEAIRLNTAILQGQHAFCKQTSITDVDYCYPELTTNDLLNGHIEIEKVTKEGCICLEPFDKFPLRNPVFLKHANDGSKRMFVGEQVGQIHIMYPNGTIVKEIFLDIQNDIETTSRNGDERGMLGMAFHPNFSQNGKFYIYYSAPLNGYELSQKLGDHKTRIEEFKMSATDPNKVDYNYSRIIMEVYEPYWNHNGGEILFGDDGYMYVFVGDGGMAGDPLRSGQDLFSMLGKVHRIDVDKVDQVRKKEYSIPPDNPFANGVEGLPEIYAYGVRNIWRCGKDRGNQITKFGKGRIVCGDVGQSAVEEVNLIQKGANYGWNLKEGTANYCPKCQRAKPEVNLTDPIAEYNHTVGKSVTGGHFYRGCQSPNLNGFYIYGDFMSGKMFRLLENPVTEKWEHKELTMCGNDICVPPLSNDYSTSIISFGEDEDGEVYMLSTSDASNTKYKGTIYRIVDPARRGNPIECQSSGQIYKTAAINKFVPNTAAQITINNSGLGQVSSAPLAANSTKGLGNSAQVAVISVPEATIEIVAQEMTNHTSSWSFNNIVDLIKTWLAERQPTQPTQPTP